MGNQRLRYLDWMRGLAVVLMIQVHVFDSFLHARYRTSEWYWLSQFLGGFPAPLFLFLAGVSLALVLDRATARGANKREMAGIVLRRGVWLLVLAYAFRIEQMLTWYPYSRWEQLFRVDILNCIAGCTLLVGTVALLVSGSRAKVSSLAAVAAGIALATPLVYPIHRGLPSWLLGYVNGAGQPGYFALFGWSAFAFSGAALGFMLLRFRGAEERFFLGCGAAGVLVFVAGYFMPRLSYGLMDYSRTSPQYFLVRLGYILVIVYGAYRWCTWCRNRRWSPLEMFGQTSLLVYWVHIEFVYGRLRPYRNSLDLSGAAAQLVWLIPLMAGFAAARQYGFKNLLRLWTMEASSRGNP